MSRPAIYRALRIAALVPAAWIAPAAAADLPVAAPTAPHMVAMTDEEMADEAEMSEADEPEAGWKIGELRRARVARHPVGRPRQVPEIESGGSLSGEGTVARKMEECFVDRQCGGEHRRQSHRADLAAIGTFSVTGHDPAAPAIEYRPDREAV